MAVLGCAFKQDTALFRSVWRRRRQATSDGSQPPLLDIGLDKDEAGLAEVDVNYGRTIGANRGEEVLRLESMSDLFQLLTIAGEKDGASSRAISDTDNVALHELRSIWGWVKRLVVSPRTSGLISYRIFVEAGHSEERIWFSSHANAESSTLWLFVNLGFPIINVVLLGDR